MSERKEPGVVTEQLELVELYLIDKKREVREAQERSLFKSCQIGKVQGCFVCRLKRWILRKRYH